MSRVLVPEVLQTSNMDCGPAVLKSLLEGLGTSLSYGRLREACLTDVDGTSIDTLQEVAATLGFEADQYIVPQDHVFAGTSDLLPAVGVLWKPGFNVHFVVLWRRHRRWVQIMDPAVGRSFVPLSRVRRDLYPHVMNLPACWFVEFALSDRFLPTFRARIDALRAPEASALLDRAAADQDWRPLAVLDAATRMVTRIVEGGGVARGRDAERLLMRLCERTCEAARDELGPIPQPFWFVRGQRKEDEVPEEDRPLDVLGTVVMRIRPDPEARRKVDDEVFGAGGPERAFVPAATPVERPPRAESPPDEARSGQASGDQASGDQASGDQASNEPRAEAEEGRRPLSPGLVAALREPSVRLGRLLLGLLFPARSRFVLLVLATILVAGIVATAEPVLLRGLVESARLSRTQQLLIVGAVLGFVICSLLVEAPRMQMILGLGRDLEVRFREAFLTKIPLLGDRYFRSRAVSELATRSHTTHQLRQLPQLGAGLAQISFEIILTTIAIAWFWPRMAVWVVPAGIAIAILACESHRLLVNADARVREQNLILNRNLLEALMGLLPIRSHAAAETFRRQQEGMLVDWASAQRKLAMRTVLVELALAAVSWGLAFAVLGSAMQAEDAGAGWLLLSYWVISLPLQALQLGRMAWQFPEMRHGALRLMDPLGAPEDAPSLATNAGQPVDPAIASAGARLELRGVSVVASGQPILRDIDLKVEPGEHIAIVGRSGAGKSSFAGLFLGWYRAASGSILVDGMPFDAEGLARLRSQIAWVDPAIQLWNRSLFDNLTYGTGAVSPSALSGVYDAADLIEVLTQFSRGMQEQLGESGRSLSGGEGQRVRLARAMLRRAARLVILDEPFRGLDRARRRELIGRARQWWPEATLLCITHDVGETRSFPRVLVIEDGRIVEDGDPSQLVQGDTRYRAMLEAEDYVFKELWRSPLWRRFVLRDGKLETRS